ncbi:MAG: DinB family protein, partial [Bryocella sp.]
MRPTILTLTLLAATGIAAAQSGMAGAGPAPTAPNPSPEIMRSYNGVKKNILASADSMPADDFGFKPKPDIRTFARILNHVSEAQL